MVRSRTHTLSRSGRQVALALLLAGAAAAAEDAFTRFDRDGDGRVTKAELPQPAAFTRYDLDRDGVITRAEYDRVSAPRGRARAPVDPGITAAEVAAIFPDPPPARPGDLGIGRQVPDLPFTDLAGRAHQLSGAGGPHGLVIAVTSATCPLSKRYLPSLAALEADLRADGIGLILVNPLASETPAEIRAQLAGHAFTAPYVHDADRRLTTALGARTTTELFLLDRTRTLIYRGALDDQYDLARNLPEPRQPHLRRAVAALRRGEPPASPITSAPGCELETAPAPTAAAAGPVTYHRDVARILQQHCTSCHQPGGVAPFALDSLAAVRDRAELLAWLTSADRPEGDPADAPLPRPARTGWEIGSPDLVVPLSRAYRIPASGVLPYQFDVVTTTLTEDQWVTAYELRPSARDVVHHVLVNVHPPGTSVRDHEEGATGYWALYVPGSGSHRYPAGFARRLPAGSRISFQIHYTPNGRVVSERLELGLVFARTPPRYEVRTLPIPDQDLRIPPGAAHHVETASRRLAHDLPVLSLMAHLHVRGKAFRFELLPPDGPAEVLLDLPAYDFNWQLRYDLRQPRLLPRGSTVRVTAVFDNSAGNPANPDPTKLVRWGPQTSDEMLIGYLEYFVPVAGRPSPAGG